MNIDDRAFQAIKEIKEGDYRNDAQRYASIQVLMTSLMEEQHELTKLACCDAVRQCEEVGSNPKHASRVRRNEAMGACLNVDAP